MTRLALMIDLERCTGCKSCEAACKQANGLGPHEYRNRVLWLDNGDDDQSAKPQEDNIPAQLAFLTVTCQQCERPSCVRACPVVPKALEKDPQTGVVSVLESRCTGCAECVMACPYGAMGFDAVDKHAVKCDLCAPRRREQSGPACASVCPTKAITFGERDALFAAATRQDRTIRDHDHYLQGPATIYLDRLSSPRADHTAPGNSDCIAAGRVPAIMADHKVREKLNRREVGAAYRVTTGRRAERIEPGGCHICFNACTVNFHLNGNDLLGVYGNPSDPVFQGRICPKSQMTLQHYDNDQRLTTPLKRIGARGEGKFIPITWPRALDEIAAKLNEIRDRCGPESLAIHAGTRTGVLNIMGFIPMFARLWGTPNTATTEPFCDAGKVVALELTQGSTNLANIYTEDDIGSARLYLYIGDNQAETRPVNFGLVNDWRLRHGARMVVVDPRLTPTASKADTWLAIRPGTDMALGLGLIHTIFADDAHNAAFCDDWILGWRQWRDFVRDKGYDAAWAAKVTDLPRSAIVELARDIAAADGCMIFTSRGINQHVNSAQTNRVFMFLAAITGNWGRKGGGYFNVAAEPDWQAVPIDPSRAAKMSKPAVSKNPAAWIPAMVDADPYPVRALITGNNPLCQWPGQNTVRDAFRTLDLIVHMECFRNETSAYADYVLPAASGIEKGGISRLAEDRRIVWTDKLIPPPGEAKSDHWFWIELGKRFGFDDVLKDDYKDPGVFWEQVFRKATADLNGVTLARLKATPHRWLRTPIADASDPQAATLYLPGTTAFGRPAGKRFPTPSGKLEFYSADLDAKFAAVGLSALPAFYTEVEQLIDLPHLVATPAATLSPFFSQPVVAPVTRIAGHHAPPSASTDSGAALRELGYDTELISGRPPAAHFHSWTHYFWQAQEMWPELYCQIHPSKARASGINDGDRVRIETPQASIEARAWLTRGIRRQAIFIPIGWGERQPFHPAKSVNFLTRLHMDPVSQQPNLKTHLCRVTAVNTANITP